MEQAILVELRVGVAYAVVSEACLAGILEKHLVQAAREVLPTLFEAGADLTCENETSNATWRILGDVLAIAQQGNRRTEVAFHYMGDIPPIFLERNFRGLYRRLGLDVR